MAGPLPSIKFIKGNSKKPIVPGICIIDDKHKFYFNKILSDGTKGPISLFYQCGMKSSTKCPTSVVLNKLDEKWWPQNLSGDEIHNHVSDKGAILAEVMKKEMFGRVAKNPETKSDDVYRNVIVEYEDRYGDQEEVWEEAIANLPAKDNLARNLRYIRSREHGPLPKNREEFDPEAVVREAIGGHKVIIMDSNKVVDKGYYKELDDFKNERTEYNDDIDDFIKEGHPQFDNDDTIEEEDETNDIQNEVPTVPGLVDYSISSDESENESNSTSRNKPKRIIAYSTKKLLKIFNQRKASGDGTFKICPSLWKQLYIVMVKFGNSWIPVVYALLPDKCKETYFTFFYMVKKQIKDMKLKFNLDSIRTDFEVGAMKAAAAVWKVVPKGCYYHFTQGGWRYVQSHNMASAYLADNDSEFKLLVKCILSLPHVPLNDVADTLDILSKREWNFNESIEKEDFKNKFLGYVKDYWLDGVIPPQVWNCFHRKVDLTNNNNESHNNYLNNAIKEAHPSPAVLTVALVKELTLAETKYNKVKSGSQRVLKKKYSDLNQRRENIKKMYYKMDRIEYLSQMGNIVMHIQLNKGQMTELRDAKKKPSDSHEDLDDDASENPPQSSDESGDEEDSREAGDDLISNDSERFNSTGANATLSSEEENHPYKDRRIGKAAGGKEVVDHEIPEYKGKKCLVCKGNFNVKSRYQICKLCDKLVHVNNNKKCLKMKKYVKDPNFICILCSDASEEASSLEHEDSMQLDNDRNDGTNSPGDSTENSHESEIGNNKTNLTYVVEKSFNYLDLTIDGFPCDGLVAEALDKPKEGVAEEESVEITTDSSLYEDGDMTAENTVTCSICYKIFCNQEALSHHIDSMHFEPCPICEKNFFTSIDKRKHIGKEHTETVDSEYHFQQHIERQSTLLPKVLVQFVEDVDGIIVDKLRKGRGRGMK